MSRTSMSGISKRRRSMVYKITEWLHLFFTMPKIFQYLSFIIRFYTNEHLPVHVHVQIEEREMKVEFQIQNEKVTLLFRKIKGKEPLTENEANDLAVFLKTYYKEIIVKWNQVFIYHKKAEFERIRKKLKRKA